MIVSPSPSNLAPPSWAGWAFGLFDPLVKQVLREAIRLYPVPGWMFLGVIIMYRDIYLQGILSCSRMNISESPYPVTGWVFSGSFYPVPG